MSSRFSVFLSGCVLGFCAGLFSGVSSCSSFVSSCGWVGCGFFSSVLGCFCILLLFSSMPISCCIFCLMMVMVCCVFCFRLLSLIFLRGFLVFCCGVGCCFVGSVSCVVLFVVVVNASISGVMS